MLRLDRVEPRGHRRHRLVPVDRPAAAVVAAQQGNRRAVGGIENGQGLPALGTGHPPVHRIVGRRAQVDRLAVAEMHRQPATRRAEAADHHRRRVRNLAGGDLTQPEPARLADELSGQPAFLGVDHRLEAPQQRSRRRAVFMTAAPPASSVA